MRSHEIFYHGHLVPKCETGIEDKLKAYYERNKDKLAEYKKAYYERNKDKLAENQKAYYERNKDKLAEYKKARYVKSARNFVN